LESKNKKLEIMKWTVLFLFGFGLFSCTQAGSSSGNCETDLSAYSLENIKGSSLQKAILSTASGTVTEVGYVLNGCKTGSWSSYFPEDGKIKSVTNYLDGALNGPTIVFSSRGQLEKVTTYTNNELDGKYAEYNYGKVLKEMDYKNGVLDGYVREYDRTGKLQKETQFKNNKVDGTLRHFNEEGEVVLEYEYKNGEKIKGGIVE
jgi:antitoxin component YwqK of YwqJK toxin-antitoxin module